VNLFKEHEYMYKGNVALLGIWA